MHVRHHSGFLCVSEGSIGSAETVRHFTLRRLPSRREKRSGGTYPEASSSVVVLEETIELTFPSQTRPPPDEGKGRLTG